MIEGKNTSGTMHRDHIRGIYPERSRRKLAPESGNALFASRMDSRDYYAYARYHNPLLGRFMSPDPLGGDIQNPQSLNRYTYVLNNPETFIDPLGLTCWTEWNSVSAEIDVVCTTPPPGLGGLKEAYFFFSEATGPNACLLWCEPTPPPDAFLFGLAQKLEKRLRALRKRFGTPQKQKPQNAIKWWPPPPREGTYGEFLACEAIDVLSDPDKFYAEGAVTVAPIRLAATGQEAKAWVGLGLVAVLDWGPAISTNVKCEREVNYHPSW